MSFKNTLGANKQRLIAYKCHKRIQQCKSLFYVEGTRQTK